MCDAGHSHEERPPRTARNMRPFRCAGIPIGPIFTREVAPSFRELTQIPQVVQEGLSAHRAVTGLTDERFDHCQGDHPGSSGHEDAQVGNGGACPHDAPWVPPHDATFRLLSTGYRQIDVESGRKGVHHLCLLIVRLMADSLCEPGIVVSPLLDRQRALIAPVHGGPGNGRLCLGHADKHHDIGWSVSMIPAPLNHSETVNHCQCLRKRKVHSLRPECIPGLAMPCMAFVGVSGFPAFP
jgi:hypothetical protein